MYDVRQSKPSLYPQKYSNVDSKVSSVYVCAHIKTMPWKFSILNPKSCQVICRWSL